MTVIGNYGITFLAAIGMAAVMFMVVIVPAGWALDRMAAWWLRRRRRRAR